MCNLYNLTPKDWANKWTQDAEGLVNLMESQDVYPDQMAPIIRNTATGKRQFVNTRWPSKLLQGPPRCRLQACR